jgi:hypothetical protein
MESEWHAVWRELQEGKLESTAENWKRCAELLHKEMSRAHKQLDEFCIESHEAEAPDRAKEEGT